MRRSGGSVTLGGGDGGGGDGGGGDGGGGDGGGGDSSCDAFGGAAVFCYFGRGNEDAAINMAMAYMRGAQC